MAPLVNAAQLVRMFKEDPRLCYEVAHVLQDIHVAGPWVQVGTATRPNWARYAPTGQTVARVLPIGTQEAVWLVSVTPPRLRDYGRSETVQGALDGADEALRDQGFLVCR